MCGIFIHSFIYILTYDSVFLGLLLFYLLKYEQSLGSPQVRQVAYTEHYSIYILFKKDLLILERERERESVCE